MQTNKSKTVFVSGNFNVFHPGHLRLLRFAKGLGEKLVVGVNSDRIGGRSVYVGEMMRVEVVKCNNWVDEAFIIDSRIEEIIEDLRPDVVVKGKEYEDRHNPEQAVIQKYGGKLVFSSGEVLFSSTDLLRKDLISKEDKRFRLPVNFMKRHDINLENLNQTVDNFSKIKVCVIGDLIIDEFIDSEPIGMSQEEPCIVVSPNDSKRFIGGAGIVASHASSLGADVELISVIGNDSTSSFAKDALDLNGVRGSLIVDEFRPTTLKKRYRCNGRTLLKVSHMHQNEIPSSLHRNLISKAKSTLSECDLLIFADFNYGCLPQCVVEEIISFSKKEKVTMVADSQSSSQLGDISRFHDMHLITPTEREARTSIRNQEDGLVVLCEKLRNKTNSKNIILTLGANGILLHVEGKDKLHHTDRIPALNNAPKEVGGAGDSFLSASALALCLDANPWEAACLGSMAAAVQVSRLGNLPLKPQDLKNFH